MVTSGLFLSTLFCDSGWRRHLSFFCTYSNGLATMTTHALILASSSPYRRQLLERLQLPFSAASPSIDETPEPGEAPAALAQRLATAKAQALANHYPNALIIGSDQVASRAGTLLGKPLNHAEAHRQLSAASGSTQVFYTGLCLLNTASGQMHQHLEAFSVTFRELSETLIEDYLRLEQPYDCAGSFKCEGLGIALFEQMQGADSTSLMGLPLLALCRLLRLEGIEPLSQIDRAALERTSLSN